jgi:type 1 glutamine amidotransferase
MKTRLLSLMLVGLTALGADRAALLSGTPQEKAALAQALGAEKDAGAADALAKAALDADPAVAYAAAEALGALGTEAAADALLKAWVTGSPATLGNGLLRCAEARAQAKDEARARALYAACAARGTEPQKAAARAGLAALDPKAAGEARPPLLERLRDESLWVRLPAIREAVRNADAAALPALFELSLKPGEDGRAAALALAATTAEGADAFLYGELKKPGAARVKAIESLAARGHKELVARLCDAALYADAPEAAAAAGSAWRACLRQEDLSAALAFTFGPLEPVRRAPLVAALAAAAQQLPDRDFVFAAVGDLFATLDADGRKAVLPLYAALQTPAACGKLEAELNSPDVEYRKEIVRSLAKWNRAEALDALVTCASANSDSQVRILALRSALTLLNKEGMADSNRKTALLKTLAGKAEREAEQRLIFQEVKRVPTKEAQALREELAVRFGLADTVKTVIAINVGGPVVGHFTADSFFEGGTVYAKDMPIDLSDASVSAPEEVYQSSRYRDSVYRLTGFEPEGAYTLRLHYAELFHATAGGRAGSVTGNGVKIIDNQPSRERGKAFVVERAVVADAKGRLEIAFSTTRDQVKVNGLEIVAEGEAARKELKIVGFQAVAEFKPVPKPVGGKINVLLLTGANNHTWQETTAALREVFAQDTRFAVAVVENPWELKPSELEGYALLFSNWNTYGKDKREWAAEMKAGFLQWVKKGGGFFVLHAGGSLFYDWDEFQALTGGSWEKGTFHPHMQTFTVNVADKEHPVTRGLKDFEIFDEPWQRVANRNPARQVLLTAVIGKENKGSGEVEPFAWTTQLGKGRCFTLMLGHDGQAIRNAGCRSLVLRGSEWAATGAVK